jgi:16S rRNA (adenine1518-N6/adenine1519-N6)-dimethyltransferase
MEGAAHVTAVERDSRTLPALAEIAAIWADKLSILADDALKIDEEKLFYNKPVKIVSNLPYNIGTALFVRWMTGPWAPWWSQLILMFQRLESLWAAFHPIPMAGQSANYIPRARPGLHPGTEGG